MLCQCLSFRLNQNPLHWYGIKKKFEQVYIIREAHNANNMYSQLFLRRTPLGPALAVRLREMSVL